MDKNNEQEISSTSKSSTASNSVERNAARCNCNNSSNCNCGIETPLASPSIPSILQRNQERINMAERRKNMLEVLQTLAKIRKHAQSGQKQLPVQQQSIVGLTFRCPTCNGFCIKRKADQVEPAVNNSLNSQRITSASPQIEINGVQIPTNLWSRPIQDGGSVTNTSRLIHIAVRPSSVSNTGKKLKIDVSVIPTATTEGDIKTSKP